jgi:hypothetical protein
MKATCSRPSLFCVAAASLALVAGLSARADSSYQGAVLGSGPLGYYRFAESAVSTVPYPLATNLGTLGAAANAADATALSESPLTKGVPGALADGADTAYRFPNPGANNNRLSIPWQAGLAYNGPFSIEFWAKPASTLFTSPGAMLKYWTSGTGCEDGNRYGWLIYQSDTDLNLGNGWQIRLYKGSGTTMAGIAQANMTITPGTWYHVVFVYTGSRVQMYVNGALKDDEAASGFKAPPFSAYPMSFGSRGYTGSTSYWEYGGDLDEIVYYTNVLSATDVANHYAAAATFTSAQYAAMILTNNPPGYWRLDESFNPPVAANLGSGGSAWNAGYRNWCTTTNDLQLVAPGYPGLETTNTTLLLATNKPGYVRIPAPNLTLTSATFECLLKRKGEQAPWAGVVFDRNGNSTCGLNFNGTYSAFGSVLGYYWNNSSSTFNFYSGLIPPDNQWVYAAVTISPSQAVMYMYDGTTWSGPSVNYVSHGPATFNAPILLGNDSGATGRFFNGQMDEVAIYTNALTEAQLHSHALTAFGGLAAPVIVSGPVLATTGDIFEGAAFTLTVDAYGAPPVGYQWLFSTDYSTWSPITGATNATFTKVSTVADTGYYAVLVSNTQGAVKSSDLGQVAYVLVNASDPPAITQDPQPAARSVYPGGNCTFTAMASGPALHYQWKHAGTNLPGATGASLTVINVDATKTGSYQLLVTNVTGSAPLSAPATLSLLALGANSYEANVVADGPESYWRLNETAGTTVLDSMGRHDGTCSGTVNLAQPGVLGGGDPDACMSFYGGYVSVPYSPDLNPTNFSVECWALLDSVPLPLLGTQFYCAVASRDGNYDSGGIRKGYNLYADGSDGNWDFWLGRGVAWEWAQGTPIQTNRWTHFVCTYDGLAGRIYVNGALIGEDYIALMPNLRQVFTIGTILDSGPYPWRGPIDEVAFYKTALSANRIGLHYQLGLYGTNSLPLFLTQPASRSVPAGSSVSFSPTLVGAMPMTYQWKLGGAALGSGTALNLSFASVDYTNAGQYTLAVTNSYGGTVSATATLVVTPPASVTNLVSRISRGASAPKLELIWPLGHTLYSTTDLAAPNWQPVSGASAPYYNVPVNPATPQMFFKIQ